MDGSVDTQEIAPVSNSTAEIQAPVYTPKNNNIVGSYILRGLALLGLVVSTNALLGCNDSSQSNQPTNVATAQAKRDALTEQLKNDEATNKTASNDFIKAQSAFDLAEDKRQLDAANASIDAFHNKVGATQAATAVTSKTAGK